MITFDYWLRKGTRTEHIDKSTFYNCEDINITKGFCGVIPSLLSRKFTEKPSEFPRNFMCDSAHGKEEAGKAISDPKPKSGLRIRQRA